MLLCLSDIIVLILIINSNMLYIYNGSVRRGGLARPETRRSWWNETAETTETRTAATRDGSKQNTGGDCFSSSICIYYICIETPK